MSREITIAGVRISRPEKEMYPATDEAVAVTKADVAGYYADLAEAMLPHLRGRPISMQRFPDGIEGSSFYEKKVPGHFPDFVTRVEVDTADGAQQQVRSEEHTSELQSRGHLVCRLLLEKKKGAARRTGDT